MKLKLLFLKSFPQADMDYLIDNLSEYYDLIIPEDFSERTLVSLAAEADVFLGYQIFEQLIKAATNLKLVQVLGTGVDAVNLDLLKNSNICLCNSRSSAPYVAEHAVALLFSLIKRVPLHDRSMREGYWFRPKNDETDLLFLSDSLLGKTVGFVGFGNIAQNIASFLKGFRVNCVVYKKNPEMFLQNDLNSSQIALMDLKSVLTKADVLFVTLPLTRETRNLISMAELRLMKKSAYLVNVSRAAILSQEGLFEALEKRYIAGAAIDVWYDDVYVDGNKKYPSRRYPFHKLDNIVMSPYRAAYFKNNSPHLTDVVKNLVMFAKESKLINIVDPKDGY